MLFLPIYNKQNIKILKNDLFQYLMTKYLGFSSRAGSLYTNPNFAEHIILALNSIKYKIFYDDAKFERMDINITYKNYKKILNDRAKALKNDLNIDPQYVNAEIDFKGKKYQVKLRLKGDTNTHWTSKIRMSFRVSVKNDTILKNKEFSISKPAERSHPYDMIFQKISKNLGQIATNHQFVDLYVNGDRWGVMNIEEQMSSVFLEKQKKKESAIVKFSNEDKWIFRDSFDYSDNANNYRLSDPKLYIQLYEKKKSLKKNKIRKYYSYISEKQLEDNNLDLFNHELLSKALIYSSLWGWHPTNISNTRFYFNPYNLNLEPILTDQVDIGSYKNKSKAELGYFKYPENSHYINLIYSDKFKNNLEKYFKNVSEILHESDNLFKKNLKLFPLDQDFSKIYKDKISYNINYINSKNKLNFYKNLIEKSNYNLGKKFNFNEDYKKLKSFIHIKHYSDGTIKLYNLLPEKIQIIKIETDTKKINFENLYLKPFNKNKYEPLTLITELTGHKDNNIFITSKYKDKIVIDQNYISLEKNSYNPLLKKTNLKILKNYKDGYLFNGHNIELKESIIFDKKLYILPGTKIFFSDDAYLVLKKGIHAVGQEDKPILLTSLNNFWKGFIIHNTTEKSILKNVKIKNVKNLNDGILDLDGAITVYNSDIIVDNLLIENSNAEDAINIVLSSFNIKNLRIKNSFSDGIDFDFSNGVISESEFINIGGDGIDTSGSSIDMKNINIINAFDKSVSIGENSKINIDSLLSFGSGIGIVSKDGSKVYLKNSKILKSKKYSAMTYFKKSFYDYPTLISSNTILENELMRQEGTNLIYNNKIIKEKNLDVQKLYN